MPRAGAWAVAAGCLLALGLACFHPVLFGGGQFAYRDAGSYYYPLYLRVQQEWAAGRLPLWDPWENAGMPLLGNPTAAVLYPGKLIYAAVKYPWAARVYILAHVALAFAAMWALLRHWGTSATGSAIGGMAYAFGAPVLFQIDNVIFLVGAAWAPLGFLSADRWARQGRARGIGALAAVLAMQALGGDLESAYLTALGSAGYAVGLAVARDRSAWAARLPKVLAGLAATYVALLVLAARTAAARRAALVGGAGAAWGPSSGAWVAAAWGAAALALLWRWRRRGDPSGLGRGLAGLAGACGLAVALAGAQLLPVAEFAAQGSRTAEAASYDLYGFSLEPYRLVELAWPNAFGTVDRGNRSWLEVIPPHRLQRVWVRSLYLGGLTLVLALGAAGVRGGPPWRCWLTAVAAVSLLGSFGEFGSPLYWARHIPGASRALGPLSPTTGMGARVDGHMPDGDGGPYWLLATALPGFGSFRYPSKLLTFFALGASGLAGLGWDRLARGESRRAFLWAVGLLAVSLATLSGLVAARGAARAALEGVSREGADVGGPVDPEGALADTLAAPAQGALSFGLAAALARLARRRPRVAGALAMAGLAWDLSWANAGLARTAPQSAFEGAPRVLSRIEAAEAARPSPGPFRVYRMGIWAPSSWFLPGAPRRLGDLVRWDRDTLIPKFGLPFGVSYTHVLGAAELLDHSRLFDPLTVDAPPEAARGLRLGPGARLIYHPRRSFDLWNTRYFILPARLVADDPVRGFVALLPRTESIDPAPGAFDGPGGETRRRRWVEEEDFRVLRNLDAYPRAWVVHEARVLDPATLADPSSRREALERLLYQDDPLWHVPGRPVHDPRRLAWVELDADRRRDLLRALARSRPDASDSASVVAHDPLRVELVARLRSPGLVVLSDVHYPGWRLAIDGRPADILRVNFMMRGALVGAGEHRLVYTYEPLSFRLGSVLSIAGLATLAGLMARGGRR